MGETTAIVCGGKRPRLCECGKTATRVCDWKIGKRRTCDKPMCDECTNSPTEGKDLCTWHATKWEEIQASKQPESGV